MKAFMRNVPGLSALNIDPIKAAAEYRERMVGPYRGVLPEAAVTQMEEQRMTQPLIDDTTEKRQPQSTNALPVNRPEIGPMPCGPGCACGTKPKTMRLKIVVMMLVAAAVALAYLYKGL